MKKRKFRLGGFASWLQSNYSGEDSPFGDLAEDALRDPKFPRNGTAWGPYHDALFCKACDEAMQTLYEAFRLYEEQRGKRKRSSISQKVRFAIFRRDNFQCVYCGAQSPRVVLEIDHKISLRDGGSSADSNLVTACDACNRGKGAGSV
jgi:hypothetical protein